MHCLLSLPTGRPIGCREFERIVSRRYRDEPLNALEAAVDDVSQAVEWVHRNASSLRIDPGRLTVGGFSAGANAALLAAYAQNADVRAVVALSGVLPPAALALRARTAGNAPAVLLVRGSDDLPHVEPLQRALTSAMHSAGIAHEWMCIDGATHFYAMHATAADAGGTVTTLEQGIAGFLERQLPESKSP